MIREEVVEEKLILLTDSKLSQYRISIKDNDKRRNPAPVRAKLSRLKELYIDGDISKDEYSSRKQSLEKELADIESVKQPATVFVDDWKSYYRTASKKARNSAWRSIIEKITADKDGNIEVRFLPFL